MKDMCSGQITLRPFLDTDIALMEKWLTEPHVAKWYLHPGHWLRELHERKGEFSFITHFIAELGSVPIGFCQYYDCYFAQAHEVWNDIWRTGDRKGEIFSLDYLIGEAGYLHRGFGKAIVIQLLEKLRETTAKTIIVQPEKENTASCRLLESCGFQYNGDVYALELNKK
jgi:RimJ/RimL family protein N-acetyltransferase